LAWKLLLTLPMVSNRLGGELSSSTFVNQEIGNE
jgi:hypothetical protein